MERPRLRRRAQGALGFLFELSNRGESREGLSCGENGEAFERACPARLSTPCRKLDALLARYMSFRKNCAQACHTLRIKKKSIHKKFRKSQTNTCEDLCEPFFSHEVGSAS